MKRPLSLATVFLCVVSAGVIAFSAPGRAGTISSFGLSGHFGLPGPRGDFQNFFTLSGSITVDTTIGVILSQDVLPPIDPSLPVSFTQGFDAGAQDYFLDINGSLRIARIYFDTASLVDYAGGALGSLADPTAGGRVSTYGAIQLPDGIVLQSGLATPLAVPEAGSGLLVMTGIGALALLIAPVRGRRRAGRGAS